VSPPSQVKTVSTFDALASLPKADCERHYVDVHRPWGRGMLLERSDVLSYETARAIARYDLLGGFRQRPGAWRYVLIRRRPGSVGPFPPDVADTIAEDHRNFLQNYRGFAGTEEVLLDRRSGQSSFVAYIFEVDRSPAVLDEPADHALARVIGPLLEWAAAAPGLRAMTLDRVETEADAEAIDAPRQRPIGRWLERTDRLGFLEFLFDQEEFAEDWFGSRPVHAVLSDRRIANIIGHRVELSCGFDHRK